MTQERYDLVVVGTSFASSFFLLSYLEKAPKNAKVLVLERGRKRSNEQNVRESRHSDIPSRNLYSSSNHSKRWTSHLSFGGNSNCWWGCAPRFLPSDFRMNTLYGVGQDWPLSYETLEPYYARAEEIMLVSGDASSTLFPRSTPFPQPPHVQTPPEKLLKKRYPELVLAQPTARAKIPTQNRAACCANVRCHLCPIDAKFRIQNGLAHLYQDPRVTLKLECDVRLVDRVAGTPSGVYYHENSEEKLVHAEVIALGANAMFNPCILLRSGFSHKHLGTGLHEQASLMATVLLDGIENFSGSTSITGHGYMLYDGEHRKHRSACLLEFWNRPRLRPSPGRWRQLMEIKMIFEDLPQQDNVVELDEDNNPRIRFSSNSDYLLNSASHAQSMLEEVLADLPVERILLSDTLSDTEDHILGTTRMGKDSATSVINSNLAMHHHPNLYVLGSGSFPTSSPANPTLTLSALSLRAAQSVWS